MKRNSDDYMRIEDALQGVLIGSAVGDSLGLPAEGLSPVRIAKNGWCPWRQRLVFGKGMISDDTEHTLFVAQSLLRHPDNADRFQQALARKLKWWLFSLPAGMGLATARAIMKLWIGVPPKASGVFSAGNGPAMRSAIIGVFFRDEPAKLAEYVKVSTRLTHSDPKALTGALAVANVSAYLAGNEGGLDREYVLRILRELSPSDHEWMKIVSDVEHGLSQQLSVAKFCKMQGLEKGVTGYMYHTVPVAIYGLLIHQANFEEALVNVLNCGGDTDTTGAILGGMLGACGKDTEIVKAWVDDIVEWPRSMDLLKRMALQLNALKAGQPYARVSYCIPVILFRNFIFLVVVLLHGFMRLLPSCFIRRLVR